MEQKKKILLTYFNPFGFHKTNSSQIVGKELKVLLEKHFIVDTITLNVKGKFNGLNEDDKQELIYKINQEKYDYILAMGQTSRNKKTCLIETLDKTCKMTLLNELHNHSNFKYGSKIYKVDRLSGCTKVGEILRQYEMIYNYTWSFLHIPSKITNSKSITTILAQFLINKYK